MKRTGRLLEQIAEPENLRLAFWRAGRGKWAKPEVRRFAVNLDDELLGMREGLLRGDYPVGRFHAFIVHDPKERVIHAAAFEERVLHHALMNVCEPIFERAAIYDSYACRRGKGQWAALARAERFAGAAPFFLKMDVRKYFNSVPHARLLGLLEQRFKDDELLAWFRRLLECYHTAPGRGLPIGSLTSQHFANFYLGPLDRFVKETLRRPFYVRYMDDCAVWGPCGRELRQVELAITDFVAQSLGLVLKPHPFINRTHAGMDFLGCRVYPGHSILNRRSRRRLKVKLRAHEQRHEAGQWDEGTLQRHVIALLGFAAKPRSWRFRQRVLADLGPRPVGLEPREPRGRLEQRRAELPVG